MLLVFVALVAAIGAAILRATVFYSWQGTYRKLLIGGLIGEVVGFVIAILISVYGAKPHFEQRDDVYGIPFLSMLFGLIVQSLLIILRYERSRKKRQK